MKKLYFLIVLLFPLFISAQNLQPDFFNSLDKSQITSGILYDRVYPIADLTSETSFTTGNKMTQALSELSRADYFNKFPEYNNIKEQKKQAFLNNQVLLSIVISEIQKINTSAFDEGYITVNTEGNLHLNQPLQRHHFDSYKVHLGAPLVESHKGLSVTFSFPESLIFNTTNFQIQNILVDFNNNGFENISPNQSKTIHFNSEGDKPITFKITLENNEELLLYSSINISKSTADYNARNAGAIQPIESTIPYQGFGESQAYTGIGEFQIFVDNVDGILDKPIIIIDGFDPGDTRDITAVYDLMNFNNGTENLADEARDLGYDVVILNFPTYIRNGSEVIDGGADFIQRNAFILVELINEINAQKVGDEELVIIGPSMGGLISRYALAYMEQNSLEHDTRLWLSFDAPHLGANVPIGFQHLLNYIAFGPVGDVAFQDLVNGLLRNPAASQMLLDHLDGHLLPGDPVEFDPTIVLPTGAPNFRTDFQNELDALGYPQDTRNIAISNGSGSGETTGTPGMNVIDWTFYPDGPGGSTRALIELYFTPPASQTIRVSRIRSQIQIVVWITVDESEAFAMSPASSAGLDSAPGGQFDIAGLAAGAGNNPILIEFLDNLNIDAFDFIPTLSSLAITTTNDWYAPVNESDINVFDAFYIPDSNEQHVTLTQENVDFARDEIFIDPLSTETFNPIRLLLENNPINDQLVLLGSLENAELQIVDLTGKVIFKETKTLENRTTIPINVSSGLYILSISKEHVNQKIKFVVR
ncbi:MAG: T9SS type A sorting domain-containing protein [Flavobacteriaceae bacterium]|nr:T9SS type A sorting domain-containing protein [Flavobacteriaceae bacterium]